MAVDTAVPLVAYGESGRRVGESHHRSRISNAMVEKVRDLREISHLSYAAISEETGVPMSSVAMICTYQRRNVRAVRYVDGNGKVRHYG
jgi:hypothetical protein